MIWLMVGLSISALVYVATVITKYNTTQRVIQSKIMSLEKKSKRLDKQVKHEQKVTLQKTDIVRGLKDEEAALKQEVALTVQKLKTAQMQEGNLEMDMYKQEFKKNKQRSY